MILQGCQIFIATIHQKGKNMPKLQQNVPKGHKVGIPNGCKLFQMALKCTSIFHSKALQSMHTQIGIFGLKIYHMATIHP
jgi:hypothetical protein